jgi:hypothetical protein
VMNHLIHQTLTVYASSIHLAEFDGRKSGE